MAFQAGVLSASGSASNEWIEGARGTSRLLPGILSTRLDGVRNRGPSALASEIAEVEGQEFYYPAGADRPAGEALAAIPALARQIRAIDRASTAQGLRLTITILGQADETGDTSVNTRLSRARAERMRDLLVAAGSGGRFIAHGAQPAAAGSGDPAIQARRRRVTFSMDFTGGQP